MAGSLCLAGHNLGHGHEPAAAWPQQLISQLTGELVVAGVVVTLGPTYTANTDPRTLESGLGELWTPGQLQECVSQGHGAGAGDGSAVLGSTGQSALTN